MPGPTARTGRPGRGHRAPCLQRIDGDALDAAVGTWLARRDRTAAGPDTHGDWPRPALAVDGKTVRGARRSDGTQVHLLSAMSEGGLVLAQREVDAKSNEVRHEALCRIPAR
jgi:hypothetical protein